MAFFTPDVFSIRNFTDEQEIMSQGHGGLVLGTDSPKFASCGQFQGPKAPVDAGARASGALGSSVGVELEHLNGICASDTDFEEHSG